MSEGCTKPATTVLFQVVGDETTVIQLPMGAFCADHFMSEKALYEKRGERVGMQVMSFEKQSCCWLPEVEEPGAPAGDELAQRRMDVDAAAIFSSPARFQEFVTAEKEWDARLGPASRDLRIVMGLVSGLIVKCGVHPRLLADYVRDNLRSTFPSVFDGPI